MFNVLLLKLVLVNRACTIRSYFTESRENEQRIRVKEKIITTIVPITEFYPAEE